MKKFIFSALTLGLFVLLEKWRLRCALRHEELIDRLEVIEEKLDLVLALLMPEEGKAERIEFYTIINGQLTKVDNMFLKVSDKLPLSIQIKDKFGNEASVDGAPSWALSDESLAGLEVSEDGKSASLVPKGQVGSFKVQVSADADLGEGVKSILGELDIELLPGEAVSVEISAGAAEPQA